MCEASATRATTLRNKYLIPDFDDSHDMSTVKPGAGN